MMGVSRRARKRTNRGHSENKDKMCEKTSTKNKQKKHIGALGRSFVRSFVSPINRLLLSNFCAFSLPSLGRSSSPGR